MHDALTAVTLFGEAGCEFAEIPLVRVGGQRLGAGVAGGTACKFGV